MKGDISAMLVYGHRGSPATHPENTLASFRAAVEAGCDGIELDVWNSADKVPVVIHDRRLERTTNGFGNVDETVLRELQMLDAGAGEPIPTLAQTLDLIDESVHLDIEVKGQNAEDAILQALGSRPRTSWAISSFDWNVLGKFRERSPDADLWVLTETDIGEAIEEAKRLGASTLAVDKNIYDERAAEQAIQANFAVMAWTANQLDECRRLRDLGVKAVCTDDPGRIIRALR